MIKHLKILIGIVILGCVSSVWVLNYRAKILAREIELNMRLILEGVDKYLRRDFTLGKDVYDYVALFPKRENSITLVMNYINPNYVSRIDPVFYSVNRNEYLWVGFDAESYFTKITSDSFLGTQEWFKNYYYSILMSHLRHVADSASLKYYETSGIQFLPTSQDAQRYKTGKALWLRARGKKRTYPGTIS